MLLITITAASGLCYVVGLGDTAEWSETSGSITDGRYSSVHYNAPANETKVEVVYEYKVDGIDYTSRWAGFWPAVGSPNALNPDQIPSLLEGGHAIRVQYDPLNPSRSDLHPQSGFLPIFLAGLFLVGLVGTFVYGMVVYPKLRWG